MSRVSLSPKPAAGAKSRAERLLAQFHEEANVASQKVDWQMLLDLLPYARPHKRRYAIAFTLMPLGAAAAVAQPMLLQKAINATGVGFDAGALGSVIALYALVVCVRFATSFAETYSMQLAGQRTMADLRSAVFAHIQKLSIRHFDRTLKSGFGAMFDDLIAALYTLLVIAVARILIEG